MGMFGFNLMFSLVFLVVIGAFAYVIGGNLL